MIPHKKNLKMKKKRRLAMPRAKREMEQRLTKNKSKSPHQIKVHQKIKRKVYL